MSLSAGDLVLFRENLVRDVPAAGVKRWTKLLRFFVGNLVFSRESPVRVVPHRRWQKAGENFSIPAEGSYFALGAQSPFWNSKVSFPSLEIPVMVRSEDPIMKSTCIRD